MLWATLKAGVANTLRGAIVARRLWGQPAAFWVDWRPAMVTGTIISAKNLWLGAHRLQGWAYDYFAKQSIKLPSRFISHRLVQLSDFIKSFLVQWVFVKEQPTADQGTENKWRAQSQTGHVYRTQSPKAWGLLKKRVWKDYKRQKSVRIGEKQYLSYL